jgi:hypothetical protein
MNLHVTDVSRCDNSNAKTLELQHLQLSDTAASSGPPYGACTFHHRTKELLIKQETISDGHPSFSIKERVYHAQS